MASRNKSAPKVSVRERVLKALTGLGDAPDLAQIYERVKRQKWPGRPKTWQASVRRTLQEIRDDGLVAFEGIGERGGRRNRRAGHYQKAKVDPEQVANRISRILEASFVVSGRTVGLFTANAFEKYLTRTYTFDVEPSDTNVEDITETLAQATLALGKWYSQQTALSIYVQVIDTDSGEALGYQWANLAWSMTPQLAAGQLAFKFADYEIKGKYAITENIARIGWRVREE